MTTTKINADDSHLATIEFQKDPALQKKFLIPPGGAEPKSLAQIFTTLYSNYIRSKEPVPANFTKRYVAGEYFSLNELLNYFDVIKDTYPNVDEKDIRVYICHAIYPANTTNPYTTNRVDDKIVSCLVFFKPPYDLLSGGAINIDGNPNCLGCYNWGDLEP